MEGFEKFASISDLGAINSFNETVIPFLFHKKIKERMSVRKKCKFNKPQLSSKVHELLLW